MTKQEFNMSSCSTNKIDAIKEDDYQPLFEKNTKIALENHRASKVWEDTYTGRTSNLQQMRYRLQNYINKRHSCSVAEISMLGRKHQIDPRNLSKIHKSQISLRDHFFTIIAPDSNKVALKFFGTKLAVDVERQRLFQQRTWIIHPYSRFKIYWNITMLILLFANLISLPIAISFNLRYRNYFWIIYSCTSDILFIFDVIVNFRTGYINQSMAGEIILDSKLIAKEYLRKWFLLDFISSLPLDYFILAFNEGSNQIAQAGQALKILRLAKLLSLIRLLRLSRLLRYVNEWEKFLKIAGKFFGILKMILLMLLLGHWNACLQFFVPNFMEFPVDSWVAKCRLENATWFEQYTWALFKALSHMLCIGYGRFPPNSLPEAWMTATSMMAGATCYALVVGHVAALIQSFDVSKRRYRDQMKQVEEYMSYRKLPRKLRHSIVDYYEHRYNGKFFNEVDILREMSQCLREKIISHNCRSLIDSFTFFNGTDENFVSDILTWLKFEVFQPNDLIIKQGALGKKMYFIFEGSVDVELDDGTVVDTLTDGSYFGEISVLTSIRRTATIRAKTYLSLYSLEKKNLFDVLENYPNIKRNLLRVADKRLHDTSKINTQIPQIALFNQFTDNCADISG